LTEDLTVLVVDRLVVVVEGAVVVVLGTVTLCELEPLRRTWAASRS
jgi:hypothetical protein